MELRPLGRTGVSVSQFCLGAMMFGAWGNTDHDESIRIIHRALDAGINIRLMRIAITTDGDQGLAAISHRLPITPAGSDLPVIFTVDLAPDDKGTFLVTCRELPGLTIEARDEDEALDRA